MSYNSIEPDEFSRSMEFGREWAKTMIKDHVTPLKNKYHKMLDLGCGTGETGKFIAQYFNSDIIFGVDNDERFLAFAQADHQRPNIHIYKICDLNVMEDFREILKGHSDVDLIVSVASFHWMDDPLTIMKTLSESLPNPVEHVHIVIKKCYGFRSIIKNIPHYPKWENYLKEDCFIPKFMVHEETIFPSDQFIKEIEKLNYHVIKECFVRKSLTIPSNEESLKFLKWAVPFTKYIPISEQDEFLKDCWLEMKKDVVVRDGNFESQYDLYLLHAVSS